MLELKHGATRLAFAAVQEAVLNKVREIVAVKKLDVNSMRSILDKIGFKRIPNPLAYSSLVANAPSQWWLFQLGEKSA